MLNLFSTNIGTQLFEFQEIMYSMEIDNDHYIMHGINLYLENTYTEYYIMKAQNKNYTFTRGWISEIGF